MIRRLILAATSIVTLASHPAYACRYTAPINLADIKYADVVLIGRVLNYSIIRDQAFRDKMLANPHLPPKDREFYAGNSGLISDYARIKLQVDEKLIGDAPRRVTFTWHNSTFGLPKKWKSRQILIALRKQSSESPPLRGPSATTTPNREPDSMTLLQAPCSSPFAFDKGSDEAQTIRRILRK